MEWACGVSVCKIEGLVLTGALDDGPFVGANYALEPILKHLNKYSLPYSKSSMHKSAYRRFEAGSVLLYDRMAVYRPDNMRVHVDFKHYFDGRRAQLPQCVADDIEQKWENAGYVGRL